MQHVFQNETILQYTCFSVCLDQIWNFTAVTTESTFFWNIMLNACNGALQIEHESYKIMLYSPLPICLFFYSFQIVVMKLFHYSLSNTITECVRDVEIFCFLNFTTWQHKLCDEVLFYIVVTYAIPHLLQSLGLQKFLAPWCLLELPQHILYTIFAIGWSIVIINCIT